MFPDFEEDNSNFIHPAVISKKEIDDKIAHFGTNAFVIESNESIFRASTSFDSFHYQTKYQQSNSALLVGFLMSWLKRCMILTILKETLPVGVVYLEVLLTHGCPLSLCSVCNIKNGLRILTNQFCRIKEIQDKDGSVRYKTPNPCAELVLNL